MSDTAPLNAARWARLDTLFQTAVALPPGEREAFVAAAAPDDARVRDELARLLAAHDRAYGFLATPAVVSLTWLDAERDDARVGLMIGAYRLLEEIGRGGMGVVYRAERADGQFERRVALKLIKRGMDTDLVLRRFRAERQILASLEHPNIAQLLDGGTSDDGRPWFVMEYVDGKPIDAYARSRALSIPDRLRLFLQVCDAVAHAHAHQVIHRDIKPANILVTAQGTPKLLDFGIAKALEPGPHDATLAVTGWRLLTPEYASPEQIEGRQATLASDVYSLGVVLHELLTDRSPGRYDTAAHATHTVPRQLRGDLETILRTALRSEASRRYASVEDLAGDIRRHLDGAPIRARPDSLAYRAAKFVRRNRAAALATAVTALVLSVVGASAWVATGGGTSLIAAGGLAADDRILVADFADRAGDPGLAAAVTDAFRADLAQSNVVRVLSAPQVRAALDRMQHPADAPVNDSLAHELAVREGATAVVRGSIARLGNAYTVSVELVGAERGESLTSVRETAQDSTMLVTALGRASAQLRRRIGESLRDLRTSPSLEQVTTASLPALRAYTSGYRRFLAGDRTGALPLIEQAVALDTAFATAHRAIASIYEAIGEPGRSRAALARSMAHLERMPFIERQFLVAGHAYATGDYRTTITEYNRVLERYPSDIAALNNLALAHRALREFAVAESLWHRAVALDSSISVLYYGMHSAQALRGSFVGSRRTLSVIARRFPDDGVLPVVRVQDAAARQDWDAAERQGRANLAALESDSLLAVDAYEALAGIVMTRGRLLEAERLYRAELALAEATQSWSRHFLAATQLAALELRYRNRPDRARALLDAMLERHPLEVLLPGDRPYDMLARLYAEAGDTERARALLAADSTSDSADAAERRWTLGVLAFAEGRFEDATAVLESAAETLECTICALPDLARAHEAAGNAAAAVAAYERYVATPWLWRYTPDGRELGRALIRMGELYEQVGNRARARAAYEDLVRLWRDAEAEANDEAQRITRRLASLDPPDRD